MARAIRSYEPEDRTFQENGLYCTHCGNTNAWTISLRLKHKLESMSGRLSVGLDKLQTKKIMYAIESNLVNMVDKSINEDKAIFQCANCENSWIDFQEQITESCLWGGCLGCFHCGQWIEKEEMMDLCSECITDRKGDVDEDFCTSGCCPASDFGLMELHDHYKTNLKEIKESLGWY
jgi:hypothetical protein